MHTAFSHLTIKVRSIYADGDVHHCGLLFLLTFVHWCVVITEDIQLSFNSLPS